MPNFNRLGDGEGRAGRAAPIIIAADSDHRRAGRPPSDDNLGRTGDLRIRDRRVIRRDEDQDAVAIRIAGLDRDARRLPGHDLLVRDGVDRGALIRPLRRGGGRDGSRPDVRHADSARHKRRVGAI